MKIRKLCLMLPLVTLLLVSGCSDEAIPDVSSPVVYEPAPTLDVTPLPTPDLTDKELRRLAMDNFVAFIGELDRVVAQRKPQTTSKLRELSTGAILKDQERTFQSQYQHKITFKGTTKVQNMQVVSGRDYPGAVIGVAACLDKTDIASFDKDNKSRGEADSVIATLYFQWENSKLKVFNGEMESVESCAY